MRSRRYGKQVLPVVIGWCVRVAWSEWLERVNHWVTLCFDVFDAGDIVIYVWRVVAVLLTQ